MRIINTIKNNFRFWVFGNCLLFVICGLLIGVLFGCSPKNSLEQAQEAVRKSENYYLQAINDYKQLIASGKELDKLYFNLGKLYFDHGDFKQAVESFKKTNDPKASKFLGSSYYRLGSFTDANEVFSKNKLLDDEARVYYGLTCEKLNLFDQALKIYSKISTKDFLVTAKQRIDLIEKQVSLAKIQDTSPEVYKLILGSPSSEEYPQAGALILLADEKIEITKDNTEISQMHYLVKIINERGKENFSESHIDYDSTFDKVELQFARTIKPDGTVADVGSRHIRDVSKYMNFPLYSNARVYIISFPEIAEGSVIEYKVKVFRNQLINKKDFVFAYPLQNQEPIVSAKFSLALPKDKAINIKYINESYNNFNANMVPKKTEELDRNVYLWEFNKIPQILPESNMPPDVEINPTMIISTFKSWEEIYDWWWALAKDKITADAAIKAKVNELIKGKVSEEEKIRAIYNFCAKDIRYVAVEYGQAGYEPHFACDIFKNKYGDCKDQAILLVTMLKEVGLSAYPVLIPTRDYYNLNPDFPSMLFNHAIAAVLLNKKIVFMDATAETCSFDDLPSGDQRRRVLLFSDKEAKIVETPLYQATHNLVRQEIKIKVEKDEAASFEKQIFTKGVYDQAQRYWLLYTPPELVEEALREKIQDVSIGAKLTAYDIKNLNDLNKPVVLGYEFSGSEYFTNAGALRIMPQLANLDNSIVARDKRKYPISFSFLDAKETIFEVALTANFGVKYLPESINEDSPWIRYSAGYSLQANKVYFKQRVELKKDLVEVADYPQFKIFFESLAKKIKQRVILEKKF